MARETKKRGPTDPAHICGLLNLLTRRKKWDRRLKLHTVFTFWDEAVGPEIASRAQPSLIRGQVLWVEVVDSIWMQQLHLQKIHLLDILNQRFTDYCLTDIRFKLNPTLYWQPPTPQAKPKQARRPDPNKLREFETLTAALGQEEIKTALRQLWIKFQGR